MATTVWKGHLTFGLVSIPVRMVRAARAERVKLRQLYRPNRPTAIEPTQSTQLTQPTPLRHPIEESSPLEETPVVPVERSYHVANGGGQPVSSADLVKGFEYSKGEYVVLEEDEIRAVASRTSTE